MAQKPDRFVRIANKECQRKTRYSSYSVNYEDVVKLLRRQHRAYVKMIKDATRYDEFEEHYPEHRYGIALMKEGRYINRENVLDDIKQYAK